MSYKDMLKSVTFVVISLSLVKSENCPGSKPISGDQLLGPWFSYKITDNALVRGDCISGIVFHTAPDKWKMLTADVDKKSNKLSVNTYDYSFDQMAITMGSGEVALTRYNVLVDEKEEFNIFAACKNGKFVYLGAATKAKFPSKDVIEKIEEKLSGLVRLGAGSLRKVDQSC